MTCLIRDCKRLPAKDHLFCAEHVAEYVNPPATRDRITVTVRGLDGWQGSVVLPAGTKTVMLCDQDGHVEELGGYVATRVARAVLDLVQICEAADQLHRTTAAFRREPDHEG